MKNEELQKWALIAEILGGLAVVFSLVFVGLEIRQSTNETIQNTNAIKSQTVQDIQAEFREVFDFPDAYLEIVDKDPSQFSVKDRVTMSTVLSRLMRIYENQWYQYQNGFLDEELFTGYQKHMLISLNVEYWFELWRLRKENGFFHPDFVEYVDQLLATEGTFSGGVLTPNL